MSRLSQVIIVFTAIFSFGCNSGNSGNSGNRGNSGNNSTPSPTPAPSFITQLGNETMGADSDGTESSDSLAIDDLGNIYVTGFTSGNFGGETNGGGQDVFVAKFNSSGIKQWVSQLGDATMGTDADGGSRPFGLALDSSGNIYVTGYTSGTLGGETNGGGYDIFVAKFNSSGTKQWVSQLGAATMGTDADGDEIGRGIAVGSSGNIYVTGYTSGTLGGETNGGGYDVFVAKFNSAGTKQWISQLGDATMGTDADRSEFGWGIVLDNSNNIYVTGYTDGTLGGEPNGDGKPLLPPNGNNRDVFVAKFNSSGTKQWVSQLGAATMGTDAGAEDVGTGIVLDSSGNIYVTGTTRGTLGGETNGGNDDVFVAKFNSSGAKQWVSQLGDATMGANADGSSWGNGIALDNSNNIYVTGQTDGTLGGELNGGYYDVFVAKFNSAGTKQWISQLGDATMGTDADGLDQGKAIALDTAGNIYVTGTTRGSLGGEINDGSDDVFVLRMKPDGSF